MLFLYFPWLVATADFGRRLEPADDFFLLLTRIPCAVEGRALLLIGLPFALFSAPLAIPCSASTGIDDLLLLVLLFLRTRTGPALLGRAAVFEVEE